MRSVSNSGGRKMISTTPSIIEPWLLLSFFQGKAALRLFAFAVPVVTNGMYFLGLFAIKGIAWSVHLWVGSFIMSGIGGLLLSYLLVSPQEPTEQKVP